MIRKLLGFLCVAVCYAAISNDTVFEVRTDGSDTNGGGFVTGASGTNWTLQAAAQYAVTDAVTAGVATSATANFEQRWKSLIHQGEPERHGWLV